MLCFLSINLIANITNLMTYSIKNAECNIHMESISNLIAFLMRFSIPFFVMLTLNLIVIWRLKHSKKRALPTYMNHLASNRHINGSPQMTKNELRFIVSTLFIDYVFLVFHFPLGVNFGVSIRINSIYNYNADYKAVYYLFANLTQLLALFHSSVLIFLFIAFNNCFRVEFIKLFRLNKIFQAIHSSN